MVKPDIKHNYYADLNLPATASVDDVRRAYHKLAFQYHPDRNGGKEEECLPKFQAIQAANEILSDPTVKLKYDQDRRKTGPSYYEPAARQPTTGNPYKATSAYPPPPQRAQQYAWSQQRTQPPNAAPQGADRFANFARSTPTARRDRAQDRKNMFDAWQSMNNASDRQRNFTAPGNQPGQPPPQPSYRRGHGPVPRNDPNPPAEERYGSGTNPNPYRNSHNMFEEGIDPRQQSAWAYKQMNGDKPNVSRSNTNKTPKKQGFNPNAPGSDERAAPVSGSHYGHRHRSEDFGRPRDSMPPPAPDPPNVSKGPSPGTPPAQRPPLRSRTFDEDAPYAEGDRKRTPYSSFIGEKTAFSTDQLRRSTSHQNTTKLSPEAAAKPNRARSNSPPRQSNSSRTKQFIVSSSSESDTESDSMEDNGDHIGPPPQQSETRRKKVPISRNRGRATQADSNRPGMHGRSASGDGTSRPENMYANSPSSRIPSTKAAFDARAWLATMFGSASTTRASSRQGVVPKWAIPSSVDPTLRKKSQNAGFSVNQKAQTFVTGADPIYVNASYAEQAAYMQFQAGLRSLGNWSVAQVDMRTFLHFVHTFRQHGTTWDSFIDEVLKQTVVNTLLSPASESLNEVTNVGIHNTRFAYQHPSHIPLSPTRSRSEENVNINFSNAPWSGTFTGEPDATLPDNPPRKPPSPTRRNRQNTKPPRKYPTMDLPQDANAAKGRVSPRPWGSDGVPQATEPELPTGTPFSEEEWREKFLDHTWSWHPQHPKHGGHGNSHSSNDVDTHARNTEVDGNGEHRDANITAQQPSVEHVADDADAMDLDPTPPPTQNGHSHSHSHGQHGKDARVYPVQAPTWRQEQAYPQQQQHPHAPHLTPRPDSSDRTSKIDTTLDGLRNVEPIAPTTQNTGFKSFADLSSSLPFQSQPSPSIRTPEPRELTIPDLPIPPDVPPRLTKSSWPAYAHQFGAYLKAFSVFNTTMLNHFVSRQHIVDQRLASGLEFLEAAGETSTSASLHPGKVSGGYASYARDVEEDVRVREAWNLGCEMHAESVKKFANIREQVRRLVLGGGLVGP